MGGRRILIVEDDPLVSAHLETIVARTIDAEITVSASVAEAETALHTPPTFALLDVDVLDGQTYAFAATLRSEGIPFVFISASNRDHVPEALRSAPFIAKPYADVQIAEMIKTSVAA